MNLLSYASSDDDHETQVLCVGTGSPLERPQGGLMLGNLYVNMKFRAIGWHPCDDSEDDVNGDRIVAARAGRSGDKSLQLPNPFLLLESATVTHKINAEVSSAVNATK